MASGAVWTMNVWISIKQALIKSSDVPIVLVQHEFSEDGLTEYRKEYRFSDCNIHLAFENGTMIDADEFDKVMTKPKIVIYARINNNDIVVDGNVLAEFNILVNTKDAGRIKLDAYTQLCQMLLNYHDFGGYWAQFGLLPREWQTTDVKDGRIIDPDLTGRLMIRSVISRFSVVGELYGAR